MAQLHVVFDLGSDSLKAVYGYRHPNAGYRYGSLENKDDFQAGIPAVALYKRSEKKWLFGYNAVKSGEGDFTTLVHIKDLMYLAENKHPLDLEYYTKKTLFPIYELPGERKKYESMKDVEAAKKLFDGGITPRELCLEYFRYTKKLIDEEVSKLRELHNSGKYPANLSEEYFCSLIFPMGKKRFASELKSMILKVFGNVTKSIDSVKAFCLYASEAGFIGEDEPFLVFDIGEKQISVAKAWMANGNPCVEGIEGHNPPKEIGGIDIDEAIRLGIEKDIHERETLGTPSFGDPGHVVEVCTDAKKYRMLQDIKTVKHILSASDAKKLYPGGVSLYLSYECYVHHKLSADKMKAYLQTSKTGSCAFEKIAQYVVSEAVKNINSDVKKIFLVGGVANTADLSDYIKKRLSAKGCNVSPTTVNYVMSAEASSKFDVKDDEKSIYACALGMAVAAVKNIDIKTLLSLSYGTWGSRRGLGYVFLNIFAKKGDELRQDKNNTFLTPVPFENTITFDKCFEGIRNDAIFSLRASYQEMKLDANGSERGKFFRIDHIESDGKTMRDYRLILTKNTTDLKAMFKDKSSTEYKNIIERSKDPNEIIKDGMCLRDAINNAEHYGMKPLFFSDICAFCGDQRVILRAPKGTEPVLVFHEGMQATPEGEAWLYFRNASERVQIDAIPCNDSGKPCITEDNPIRRVFLSDIVLRPKDAASIKFIVQSN